VRSDHITSVAAAGHVTEVHGPVQALHRYLAENRQCFAFAEHPFSYTNLRTSRYEHVVDGKVVERSELSAPSGLSWLRDIVANFVWFGLKAPSRVFIGIDNLNAFCGIILRLFRRTEKVVYYVIDYSPKRFKSPLLNALYHLIDRFVAKRADEIWNISDRIADVRRRQGVPPTRNRIVGVGVDLRFFAPADVQRHRKTLVVASHLTESKGVQLAIRAMASIIRHEPAARLLVIGVGPYEAALRSLAERLGLAQCVQFYGLMSHEELVSFLPTCGIALAPYLDDPTSITYYADPTKPKEYLAAGLPVVVTDVPWIAGLIASSPMGVRIRYSEDELTAAVLHLMRDDQFYERCSRNARAYASQLDWSAIYDRAFALLQDAKQ
jgi:glycosyltransferase involved in cell wall biosynthesis